VVAVLSTIFKVHGGIQRFNRLLCLALDELAGEMGFEGRVLSQDDSVVDYERAGAPWRWLRFVAGGGGPYRLSLRTAAVLAVWLLAFLLHCYFQAGTFGVLASGDRQALPGLPRHRMLFRTFSLRDFLGWGGLYMWRFCGVLLLFGAFTFLLGGGVLLWLLFLGVGGAQWGSPAALGIGHEAFQVMPGGEDHLAEVDRPLPSRHREIEPGREGEARGQHPEVIGTRLEAGDRETALRVGQDDAGEGGIVFRAEGIADRKVRRREQRLPQALEHSRWTALLGTNALPQRRHRRRPGKRAGDGDACWEIAHRCRAACRLHAMEW